MVVVVHHRVKKYRRRLQVEALESRRVLAAPYGALPDDTAEYLLGRVLVTPVFIESDGSGAENTEDWNDNSPNQISETKQKIQDAMQWWVDTLAGVTSLHSLEFVYDFTYADTPVLSSIEPISHPSNDYVIYVNEFLDFVNFNSPNEGVQADIRKFNHAQREAFDTDWAFTIFVVDSENDPDHRFAPTGSHSQAFAFPGGTFFVAPSTRPVSTFAHEMGHEFWARDEYVGGGSFTDRRGYYDAQNLNAADNPAFQLPGNERENSIMAAGVLMGDAFLQNVTSDSSMRMVGWQDSDGDGVFDVLDVPHHLEATGVFNSGTGEYRIAGRAVVGTLPNQNSSGLQSDITLNKIDALQYRVDGGAWQTASSFVGQYEVDFDVTLSVGSGASDIEFRTVTFGPDQGGGGLPVITASETLATPLSDTVAVLDAAAVAGVVYNDIDRNGMPGPGEPGIAGTQVALTDGGSPLVEQGVEPDDYPDLEVINTANPDVTLTAEGFELIDDSVMSRARPGLVSTGNRAFAFFLFTQQISTDWLDDARELVMDFASPVSRVSLDAIANSVGDVGRLEIFDAGGNLLARYQTGQLSTGEVETMTLTRPTADIASARAYGNGQSAVHLDNLRFGPEVTAVTDALGGYRLAGLTPGAYTLEVQVGVGQTVTAPATGAQSITVTNGVAQRDVDFGVASASLWQNPLNRFDVNGNGVSLSQDPSDIVELVTDLILNGARELNAIPPPQPPPYLDINGDGFFLPDDLVDLVAAAILDAEGGSGEGGEGRSAEAGGSGGFAGGGSSGGSAGFAGFAGGSSGEGEFELAAESRRETPRAAAAEADSAVGEAPGRLARPWLRLAAAETGDALRRERLFGQGGRRWWMEPSASSELFQSEVTEKP